MASRRIIEEVKKNNPTAVLFFDFNNKAFNRSIEA